MVFFAHIGRVRDRVLNNVALLNLNSQFFVTAMADLYAARNITLHGVKVPMLQDGISQPLVPNLEGKVPTGNGWSDKQNEWGDIANLPVTEVSKECEIFFSDMIGFVRQQYAEFQRAIRKELADGNFQIVYHRTLIISTGPSLEASGSTGL